VTATAATPAPVNRADAVARSGLGRRRPRHNPWRHPWFLEGFTWLYLLWSLVPIGLAVLFSFNNGHSQAVWQGFSWRWYFADPLNSVLHDPNLHAAVIQTIRLSVYTTLICVPLGVAFALGINRWRGAVSASANFAMILSFVIPELIFGVALFFVFTQLFTFVGLGTWAEVFGLVGVSPVSWLGGLPLTVILGLVYGYIPYLILVLYAGLDRIDPALIEAGRDLGLGRARTFIRVTLPLSRQAILTGMLITVLPMLGDYFTNQLLSGTTSTTMIGNVIDGQLQTPAFQAEGAVLSLMLLLILTIPMVYYVVATNRSSRSAA